MGKRSVGFISLSGITGYLRGNGTGCLRAADQRQTKIQEIKRFVNNRALRNEVAETA
jgi:hypothetical protein